MRNKHVLHMVQAALIAAMYVVLTWVANLLRLANGVIQVRFSEALTILPFFTPAAIPGLFVGCIISNTITGSAIWDILFGSLATLIGAFFTYKLRHISKWLAPLPPILANILVVPQVLRIVYGAPDSIWYLTATVGIGEVISCGILGMILLFALQKNANQIFQWPPSCRGKQNDHTRVWIAPVWSLSFQVKLQIDSVCIHIRKFSDGTWRC